MDNKILNHVSRHGAAYMIVAALMVVGGISMTKSVPNFHAANNSQYTGNVGQLSNPTSALNISAQGLQSAVLKTGETLNMNWSNTQKGVKFYLVPENVNQKAIPISGKVTGSGQNRSFSWQIPASVQSGNYSLGLESGGNLAQSGATFTIVQGTSSTNYVMGLNAQINTVKTDLASKENKLTTYNDLLTDKQNALATLKSAVIATGQKLQKANTTLEVQAVKTNVSNKELSTLKIQLATNQAAVTNMQGQIYKLQKVIATLENEVIKSTNLLNNLNGKLSEAMMEMNQTPTNNTLKATTATEKKENPANLNVNTATEKASVSGALTAPTASNNFQNTGLQAQMNELNTLVTTKSAQLKTLYGDLQVSQNAASQAKNEVSALAVSLQEAKNTVNLKETELKQALFEVQNLKLQIDSATSKEAVSDLEMKLKTVVSESEKAQLELSLAQTNVSSTEAKNLELQNQVNVAEKSVTELQLKVQNLENEINEVNLKISDAKKTLATMEQVPAAQQGTQGLTAPSTK